ncbi:nitroreductase family protein [Oceaniglobus trochenteri]|uniref:nitroreductase family protein n=1 Tax=Oceaniglobus trochenteri TaxID=2763260 RepID=UPI001CFF8F20|nr:nitroreductase family protein [Oceaniglobus trochenteri]
MPQANPAALEFLLTRRSRPARTLGLPIPGEDDLRTILTAAARTPDHGKLEPWRFIVLDRVALLAMAEKVAQRGAALNLDPDKQAKARDEYANAHLAVAVVAAPRDSDKIPRSEQVYSAGATCLALLNAALAAGWGANWLSGWPSRDPEITAWLGLAAHEDIAGFIHLGTESAAPPDRPRPDIDAITTRFVP